MIHILTDLLVVVVFLGIGFGIILYMIGDFIIDNWDNIHRISVKVKNRIARRKQQRRKMKARRA